MTTGTTTFVLPAEVDAAIRRHARDTYPHECCGALIGRGTPVAEAFPLPNTTDEGPRRRFLVRPDDYRAAERRAAERGGELLGFYHSHPDHPARPSQYDLDHAWPTFAYVIVAVTAGEPGDLRNWRLRPDRSAFEEEPIVEPPMPVTIPIPTPPRPFTDQHDAVTVEASSVGDALARLTDRYAALRPHLYAEDGRVRSFVNVYLNDEDVRYLQKEATPVREGDTVSLQRQILFGTPDVGRPKLAAARARLEALNPGVKVETHDAPLSSANALDVLREYDVVVDGTDNFPTRYLVNDACVLLGKPNAYGSIFRFEGQASVFAAQDGPCYRCLYPEPPPPGLVPSCAEGGVLGVLPGIVGTVQATEALKLILGAGDPLVGRFLIFDALRMRFRELKVRKDPDCPVCGTRPTVRALIDYEQFCGVPARNAAPAPAGAGDLDAPALRERLDRGDALFLLDVREPNEHAICRIDGATLIPLGQLQARLDELPTDRDIVVFCKVGARSARAVALLNALGIARAHNLRGGILEWIEKVEPSLPRY